MVAHLRTAAYAPLQRRNGFDQEWILQQLKSITYPYYVWFVRHEDRLQAALTMVEFVKNHLSAMMYGSPETLMDCALRMKLREGSLVP